MAVASAGHVQVCTSLQTDNHTSTSPLSFLQAGCPSCRPTNSVKALKAQLWPTLFAYLSSPVQPTASPCLPSHRRPIRELHSVGGTSTDLAPDLQNILRQSCDYLTIMPNLRSTYDRRLIRKTSYEGRKAFLRYNSLAKS